MDPLRQEVENNIDVLIRDSKIEKIGKNIKKAKAKIIDGEGKYLLPGLINCHAHIPMSLFREISDGHKLIQ
jgi:imidazolonepropionase-like amidohydrolase